MPGKSTKKHPPAYKGLIGVKDSFDMYTEPKLDMIYVVYCYRHPYLCVGLSLIWLSDIILYVCLYCACSLSSGVCTA